jgi:hypothetical protein
MALNIDVSDPSKLTKEEILYLQDRDRLPEGVEPIPQDERDGVKTVLVATATGSATVPESELDKYTGRDQPEPDEDVVEVDSYDDMTVEDLKAELQSRKLSTAGNKGDMVKRLEMDDAKSES